MRRFTLHFISTAIATTMAFSAAAQTTPNTSNVDRYDANYFMAFEPQTLYDVLEHIPGATAVLIGLSSADETRGFGSAGDQVLINNKRVSGKDNSVEKELDNILARDVEYIELIRGTRSDLDVQSEGLVINVVLKQTVEASVLWTLGARTTPDLSPKPYGSVVYSNGFDKVKYRLGVERYANPTQFTITDRFWTPDNQLTQSYIRQRKNRYTQDGFSGKFEYLMSDDTQMQISALYQQERVDSNYISEKTDWLEDETSSNNLKYDWQRDIWEISGDITHNVNADNHLKLLFISNKTDADDQIWLVDLLENNQTAPNYRLPRLYVSKENVLRGNWKLTINPQHSLDSGLEVAINEHDETVQFEGENGDTYHSTEINDIEEVRYEAFVNHNYTINAQMNLQSSLVYETSTLDVTTDFQLQTETLQSSRNESSRTFSYLKPRINFRYDLNDNNQLRFNYQRTVSQLNLDDFVPEFNRDEARLEETNPELKPEMRDEFSMSWEIQWQDKQNSVTVSPYFHKITDLITQIPLVTYSGDGNVDDAIEYGLTLDSSLVLTKLGLENTHITASYTLKDSEVTDPFTGEDTIINGFSHHEWNLKIDQNEILPGLSASLSLAKRGDYPWARYDFRHRSMPEMTANGFIDYQINEHIKLRLKGDHLLNRKFAYDRERFEGLYTETDLIRREHRSYRFESRYSLILSGQF